MKGGLLNSAANLPEILVRLSIRPISILPLLALLSCSDELGNAACCRRCFAERG